MQQWVMAVALLAGSGARSGDSDWERPTTCRVAPQLQDTTYVEAGGDVPDDLVCARSRSWCMFVIEGTKVKWRVRVGTRKIVQGQAYRCAADRRIPPGVTYWWNRPPTTRGAE